MNRDKALKIQAFLDGELSKREARDVERDINADADAALLLQQLRWTRQVVSQNEPVLALPESREFFWGKIERDIERLAVTDSHSLRPWSIPWRAWMRWLSPAFGVALVVIMVFFIQRFWQMDYSENSPRYLALVESPSEEMGAFSFRSQSENMFVIWLYDRPAERRNEMNFVNDLIIQ